MGIEKLEAAQRETNKRIARIEETLKRRLDRLEQGQKALVEVKRSLVLGEQEIVDRLSAMVNRLDRFVTWTTEDRTEWIARIAALERRIDAFEKSHTSRP